METWLFVRPLSVASLVPVFRVDALRCGRSISALSAGGFFTALFFVAPEWCGMTPNVSAITCRAQNSWKARSGRGVSLFKRNQIPELSRTKR